jgi:hypothetical protein
MAWQWKFLADIQGTPGDVSLYGPGWAPQRNVPATADLNTFKIAGVHRITTPDTQTILNLPAGMSQAGIFENLQTGTGTSPWWVQRITQHGNAPRMWWRSTRDTSGGWNDWQEVLTDGANITELHVFLAAGQSNMSGRGAPSGGSRDPENPRILQYGAKIIPRALTVADVPLDMHDTATGISPATTFARTYLKTQPSHVGVLIIPAAHGSTGFTNSTSTLTWTPNVATDPTLDLPALAVQQTLDGITAAKGAGYTVSLEGILWHQGENNSSMSQSAYAAALDGLIGYFRDELDNSKLPFMVGQMCPEGIEISAGKQGIDAAHKDTPSRVAYTGFAPSTRGGHNSGDTTHLSRIGIEFLGRTYAEAFVAASVNEDIKPRLKAAEASLATVPATAAAAVPAAVAAYIASDPTVIAAAADLAANNTGLVAKWKPSTAYVTGQQVVTPDGDVVTRASNGTSGSTYTATNWTPSVNATGLTTKLDASQKGAASGVATLDTLGRMPTAQGPAGLPVDQLDYVAALALRSKTVKMQLKKADSTGGVEVSCITAGGNHVTYQFYGNAAGDDYRVLANVWAGTSTATTAQVAKKLWADLSTTGTYTATAGAFVYTTGTGSPATFTASVVVDVAGSTLRFHTYKDNQGGVWQLTISGAEVDSVQSVSTWASSAAYDSTGVAVFNNLRPGTYTIVGKFLGDDAAHAPSGGAGTARGWLSNNADGSSTSATLFAVWAPFRAINKDILLKPASNMDFAMQVKPAGGSTLEWVPYHGVATAIQADAPVYLDGDVVVDVTGMATGAYRALTSFEIVQRVYGRNSTSGSTNLIEVATSHLIRADSQVTVSGKWKALASIELGDNYVMMLPASMALFDQLATSIGNAYRNGADLIGTETALVAENDTAMAYLFLASTNKSVAAAARFNNVQETIRRGKGNKNPDATKAFLQHRDSSIVKVYNRPYAAGTAIPSGTVNRFGGDYIFAQGLGLYDQFAL